MNIKLGDMEIGPGYWKCNNNVLRDINSAFEQGNLDLWRYINAFIIIIINVQED